MYSEDRKLVKRLLAGDEAAFDQFFHQYYPRVIRFCLRRIATNDAEDVAMETVRQAVRRIETYRGEATLLTWIYQIARSQLSAFYKRESKHANLILIEDDEQVRDEVEHMASELSQSPEALSDLEQRQRLIHYMLDALPGDYGLVLQRKYIEGFSVEQIATELATSPTAIQSMLARARKAFKNTYNEIMHGVGGNPPVQLFASE